MLGAKREMSFKSLMFDQYVLGESQILNRRNISELERNTCIYLMKRISKLNERIGFSKSKELYRETLLSIEKGEFSWDNFYEIEKIENEIRFENMKVESSPDFKKKSHDELKWCKDYNMNKCTFQSHHHGKLGGVSVKLWHICRIYWMKSKEKKFHRFSADDIPFHKKE